MNKVRRQRAILALISEKSVETQEELVSELRRQGFDVTQATVSRDIKELKLVKVQNGDTSSYASVEGDRGEMDLQKYKNIIRDTVVSVDCAMNIMVVKCHVGMGNAACVALDMIVKHPPVGTIAGDDTVFVAFKTVQEAEKAANELKSGV